MGDGELVAVRELPVHIPPPSRTIFDMIPSRESARYDEILGLSGGRFTTVVAAAAGYRAAPSSHERNDT
jgi:hypothetical protein